MRFRTLVVRCECGRVPTRLRDVGFTEDAQLVIHWWCTKCRAHRYLIKDLAECWSECSEGEAQPAPDPTIRAQDAKFLRSMGIRES